MKTKTNYMLKLQFTPEPFFFSVDATPESRLNPTNVNWMHAKIEACLDGV